MSINVYPSTIKGLTWNIIRNTKTNVLIQTAPNGYEVRVVQTVNPIRTWTLTYEYVYGSFISPNNLMPYAPYTDQEYLQAFWLQHYGQGDDFLFKDPTWNSIGPALVGGVPNLLAKLQLWNDGSGNYYSPLQYNWGGLFWEDITDLNPPLTYPYTGLGAISVYANGVALRVGPNDGGHDCGIFGPGLAIAGNSCAGLYIKFYTPSPPTAPTPPITVTCEYLNRVRFDPDNQDWEEFLGVLYTIGGPDATGGGNIVLVTSRPGYYGT